MNTEHLAKLLLLQAAQLAIMIAVIAILSSTLLRHRPHIAYALWLVALAKCLCPPVWSSPTSLFSWAFVDADHKPVAGVAVDSVSYVLSPPERVFDSAKTDASGRFALQVVRTGTNHVSFHPAENAPLELNTTDSLDLGEVVAPIGRTVTGTVADTDGKPFAGIKVLVHSGASSVLLRDAMTDSNGRYQLAPLAPGNYRISLFRPGNWRSETFPQYMPMPISILEDDEMSKQFTSTVITVKLDGPDPVVDFRPTPRAKLIVHTVDPDGRPTRACPALVYGAFRGTPCAWIAESPNPTLIEASVPVGVTDARLGVNRESSNDLLTIARYRRGSGPVVDADVVQLGTITGDVTDITVIRYPRPTLNVMVTNTAGKEIGDAECMYRYEPATDGKPQGRYAEMTDAFFRPIHKPAQAVLPDEPIFVKVTAKGFQTATQQLTLQLGENKTVEVKLTPLPTTSP